MSPIRMLPGFLHPRGPRPRAVRKVRCPGCDGAFEVSRRALAVRCPHCTRPLRFEDVTLRRDLAADLSTMGHVRIPPSSAVSGHLTCGQLTNLGRFDGAALVHGPIELLSNSLTTGELAGQSLVVPTGATVRVHARIAPRLALASNAGGR